jgi:hypothetical protein
VGKSALQSVWRATLLLTLKVGLFGLHMVLKIIYD